MRILSFWIIFLLFSLTLQSQTLLDDFEGGGSINSWFGDACGMDVNFSNPYQQGLNTSATVLRYDDTGGQYANVRFDVSQNFDLTTLNSFKLLVYVPSNGISGNQPNQVSLKLQDGTLAQPWSTQTEIIKPIVLDQWQELTFDFENDSYINLDSNSLPPVQRTDFNRVVIQLNGENNNDLVVAYIDDIVNLSIADTDPVFDQLVWFDEFDGSGAVDTSKWFHQTQLPNGTSWYNGEVQHYTDRIDNAYVAGGYLNIVAQKESFTDQGVTKQYTSARLNSKFAFTYGKVEIRAKLPSGVGTWPALWMLGKNVNEDGGYWDLQGFGTQDWPACGEVDIMEHWGTNQNYVQSAIHTPSSFGGTVNLGGQTIPTASTAFHIYTLEWSDQKMKFSVDGVQHYTYNPSVKDSSTWPFDAEQYILLNVAILPSIDPAFTSGAMQIDYVRVYQESALSNPVFNDKDTFLMTPNPVEHQLNIQLQTPLPEVAIRIVSRNGREVSRSIHIVYDGHLKLHVSNLHSGLYFIQLISEGQVIGVRKFIKR